EAAILSTRWMDALSASVQAPSWRGQSWARRRIDSRAIHIAAVPGVVWEAVRRIGGRRGYYYGDWLWQMRGAIDLLFGGAGMRRGRRDPRQLLPGDTVDFWRVEAVEPERLLRLTAEMRLPGRAWLQFELQAEEGGTCLRQTAIYDPRGAMGILYWWSVAPLHHLVFGGMLRGLAEAAAAGVPPSAGTEPPPTALTECPA
ncbi:MAG: DUF2867 domain-containing protein, partial [bacterium]|nr:DUF2867 domain-containing protein [bacterium]